MRLLALVRKGIRATSLVLLALLIVTPLAQIVMRGIFNVPMSGAEELARYFLICLTFLAASYVTHEGGQIRMEEAQALLGPRVRFALQVTIDLVGIAMFATFFVAGAITIRNNLQNQTATLEMPFWLFMGPLVVGSLLLVIETTALLVHTWKRGRAEEKHTVLS